MKQTHHGTFLTHRQYHAGPYKYKTILRHEFDGIRGTNNDHIATAALLVFFS